MSHNDLTTDFNRINEKATAAAGQLRDAVAGTRETLRSQMNDAHQRAIDAADELDARVAELKDDSASRWQELRAKWTGHVAAVHARVDEHKARVDSDIADTDADLAEVYAEDAINFALAAIDEAQSAALGALYARASANALRTT